MSLYHEPLKWDESILRGYDISGPRYTSYPTAPQFGEEFSDNEWRAAIARSNSSNKPLSLYFHIPFCETLCFYCACNKVVTNNTGRAMPYLERVGEEMARHSALFDRNRQVTQLHWGGGTPSYISEEEMTWLMADTRKNFNLLEQDEGEFSVEIHPGKIAPGKLAHMRRLGFNRVSMGVQDFNPDVQEAVNRFNSVEQVGNLVTESRQLGYQSVSMDLIYGLPRQTEASVAETLDRVIDLQPDRLSLFNYAHLPHLFRSQTLINAADIPDPAEKLSILQQAIASLQTAGYVYVGMDHFAKPDDSLVIAQQQGKLQRNFQGYSTHGDTDLIAFGVSAISDYGGTYIQNAKNLENYQERIGKGEPAFIRGFQLQAEDHLRRYVINQLICHFQLNFSDVQERFGIDAQCHFFQEIDQLAIMQDDGLIELSTEGIRVLNAGRLLIRRICMVFDEYLNGDRQISYSKLI